jgi:hypothetical protein
LSVEVFEPWCSGSRAFVSSHSSTFNASFKQIGMKPLTFPAHAIALVTVSQVKPYVFIRWSLLLLCCKTPVNS